MFRILLGYKPFIFICICYIALNNLKAENGNINFPAFFMKNQGQFNNESQYCLKSAKSNTFFFENHIVNQFISPKNEKDTINPNVLNLRIDFENSNPHSGFEERDPLASKSNFFIGNDASFWKTDIASFATLAYKELYDKIDLVYFNSAKGIKSDFVVYAGGNYLDIVLKYSGVKSISINPQGALEICTDAGELTEHIPEAYQMINDTKVMVNVNFSIKNSNIINFDVGDYNPDYDLVIDPQLIYCSYIGGSGDDYMLSGDIERDASNNIYLTGRTSSFNFPVTTGSYSNSMEGSMDVYILKMNPTGQILFSTFIGGSGNDMGYALELAGTEDDIIVTGDASSTFPTTAGAYQTSFQGGTYDAFVLKLNNTGNKILFSTYLGGSSEDQPFDFALDDNQDIYVVGQTAGEFPITAGSFQEYFGGGLYDVFVSKLTNNGSSLLKSTYIGGTSIDRGVGITVDAAENVYISATTSGDFPTTSGCFNNSYNGGTYDIILAKLNAAFSNLIYSTFIGTNAEDQVRSDLILDNANNLLVVGKAGNGFPTTSGSFQPSYGGGLSDGLIFKLNSTGTALIYASYLGGNGDDYILYAANDANSNIIVTGFCGSGFPVTICSYDESFNGETDAFIAKINPDISKLLYSTYFGGNNTDNGMAVSELNDTVIMVGETQSFNLPVTSNAFDATYNGQIDIFLAKIGLSSGEIPVAKFNNSPTICINQPINFINVSLNSNTYSWNFGDGITSNTVNPTHAYSQPGNYLVSLIALNSCGSDTVSGSIKLNGYLSTNPASICSGDSLLVDGLYRHNPGNYNETYPSSSGCDSIITTNLSVIPILHSAQNPSICQGETFPFGTHSYSISGTYTDILKAFSGCDSIVSTNLTVKPLEQTAQNPSICQGETFKLGIHYYAVSGTYKDTLTTVFGCDSIVITHLTVNPLPIPSLGNDTLMCPGELIVLSPGSGFSKYLWSDGTDLNNLRVTQPGTYSVYVSDALCTARDTVFINDCGDELWFPNVFTPNNDGINERFRPVSQGVIQSYQIFIFNRWGQQLYESNDAYPGWDGTYQGNQCPSGAYFFVAEFSLGMYPSIQKQRTKRGSVTLLR